ncbi:MAG: methionine adenosyltransferase [Campylobacter sp.]|nr:methionine adenosyltransferase [Campylobacter sp.]
MTTKILFTSESVSEGHPDKVCDQISDAILDACLKEDPKSRVACEVFATTNFVVIGGEITTRAKVNYEQVARNVINEIGYTDEGIGIDGNTCEIKVVLDTQSPDIALGTNQEVGGAGDQGIMFGFASNETSNLMPAAITYARMICDRVYDYALKNPDKLGVDIKTQVTVDYGSKANFEDCQPEKIHTIVVSAPSVESLKIEEVRALIKELIDDSGLPQNLYDKDKTIIYINPTGRYVNHSSLHDSGLTGRKLIVDSFGGYSPIGGGAQSSKDYTKVDRSGLYAARWIAKNIVAAGLAKKCIVQLSYAIGVAKPVSVSVDCMGTNINSNDDKLSEFVHDKFALTPKWITDKFGLDKPSKDTFLYADVAAKGQVGDPSYPWEQLDAIEIFKQI